MVSFDVLPKFFVRDDKRVVVYGGLPTPQLLVENKWTDKLSTCGALSFSDDGILMASSSVSNVVIFDVNPWKQRLSLTETDVTNLYFSPKSNVLCTYKPHSVNATLNLKLWCVKSAKLMASFVELKRDTWHPLWSADESITIRMTGTEIYLYTANAFDAPIFKATLPKMRDVALSPGPPPFHVCIYNVAHGNALASATLYRSSTNSPIEQMITNKVFSADRANFYWNARGKAVVVMAVTDVDPENKSYYGREALHLLKTDGDACLVVLGRVGGPVHAVQWHPDSKQFCVVHGSMPATATLFDLKADPVFTFPPAARNDVHFNAFGNLLCLCGFGSVSGNLEFWCLKTRRLVSHIEADQTTFVEWSPDGQHFMTATTAPRLRVNNGFKVWHYTGQLVHEMKAPDGTMLVQIGWSPEGKGRYAEPVVDLQIANSKPVVIPKPQAYVPPHLRGRAPTDSSVVGNNPLTDGKAADAGRKKKVKNKRKTTGPLGITVAEAADATDLAEQLPELPRSTTSTVADGIADKLEREKRIQVICRKLREIAQLKEKVDGGYQMKPNQVPKLASENSLLAELESLKNAANVA